MSVVRKLRDKKGVDQELEALVAQALIEILVATLVHRTPPCLGVDRGSRRPERAATPRRACLRVPTVLSSRLVFPSGPEDIRAHLRSEEHTSELQSLMRISYAVFCLKKKPKHTDQRDLTT